MQPEFGEPLRRIVRIRPLSVVLVVLLLAIVFGVALLTQRAQVQKLNQAVNDIQAQVLEAYARAEELERQLAFTQTDAYVEQEARRRFGYIGEGETRFMLEDEAQTGTP